MKKFVAGAIAIVLLFAAFAGGYHIGCGERGCVVEANTEPALGVSVEKAKEEKSLLNLNTATAAQLMEIPYVGEKLAEAIVSFREENGAFHSVWELTAVNGIGEGKLEIIAPYLTIE